MTGSRDLSLTSGGEEFSGDINYSPAGLKTVFSGILEKVLGKEREFVANEQKMMTNLRNAEDVIKEGLYVLQMVKGQGDQLLKRLDGTFASAYLNGLGWSQNSFIKTLRGELESLVEEVVVQIKKFTSVIPKTTEIPTEDDFYSPPLGNPGKIVISSSTTETNCELMQAEETFNQMFNAWFSKYNNLESENQSLRSMCKGLDSKLSDANEKMESSDHELEQIRSKLKASEADIETWLLDRQGLVKILHGIISDCDKAAKVNRNERDEFEKMMVNSLEEKLKWSVSWEKNRFLFILFLFSLPVSFYLLVRCLIGKFSRLFKPKKRKKL